MAASGQPGKPLEVADMYPAADFGSVPDRSSQLSRLPVTVPLLDRDAGTERPVECATCGWHEEALMGTMHRSLARTLRGFVAATMLMLCVAGGGGTASAAAPDCAGRGVPTSKISIQLWTFAEYIGFGTDAATIARTEEVFGRLSEMGYRNVEPFTLSGMTAEQYRALLDKYGLKASARHVDVGTPQNPGDIEQILADNRTLGLKYFGSGSTPIFPPIYTTEAEWIAYAEYINELGALARRHGQNLMVHNHNVEFETVFGDQTVYDILMAHTDPKNVVFQLDLYWATNGGGVTNPLDVIERYGNRIKLFHVKDMAAGTFPGRIEIVGQGIIDFPAIFEAAGGSTKYYVVEHDPRFGDPTFDPFEAAQKGFDYLDCVTF
jgi:sugar phosphate isomerase/epimerase